MIGRLFFFNKFIYYYYFWLHWVFVAVHGFSLVAASGGYSSLRRAGFSLRWLLLLRSMGSRCVGFSNCGTWALERGLSSCGTRAQLLRGMWDLPGPGLKPASCIGRWILNHCATRETLGRLFKWPPMMDFPGGPVVKIPHFHCRGRGFGPWLGKFCMPCGVANK